MKRLWLIPALAAAAIAAGCGSKPQAPQGQGDGGWQTCTDQQGRIVDERQALPEQQAEDLMTSTYLRDTAIEAGLTTDALLVGDIGWDPDAHEFVDLQQRTMRSIFKLYPWGWMVWEEFGAHALDTYQRVQWIEPIWKMLWSNKAILAVLWELFPHHPNLIDGVSAGIGIRDRARWSPTT